MLHLHNCPTDVLQLEPKRHIVVILLAHWLPISFDLYRTVSYKNVPVNI